MEEVAICECGCRQWKIYWKRIECISCGKEYRWKTTESYPDNPTLAQEIINLVKSCRILQGYIGLNKSRKKNI